MIVIPGPASVGLGQKVAEQLGGRIVPVESKAFPDGEAYIRLTGSVSRQDVAIIQTTSPPQDVNLLRLLLMVDAARDLGAKSINAVVPYLAYARQDKRFREGEAVSAKTVIHLIEDAGAGLLTTVNVHNPAVLVGSRIRAENLSAMPVLASHFKELGLKGAFSLAPDEGAEGLVKEAAAVLGGGYGWLKKSRDRITGEIAVAEERLIVKGRDAVVFDDIISTGGTMAAAVGILKAQGARRVYAACVHPLLVGDAEKKILGNGAEGIVGTDCVPSHVSVVSVAPVIVEALKRGV